MAAPLLAVGDVLAIQIVGRLYEQATITTFHWQIVTLSPPTNLTDVLTDIVADVVPDFITLLSNSWLGVAVRGRRVTPSPTRSYEVPFSTAGAIVSPSLPPSVAGVISRFTNSATRAGRGRIFVPAVPTVWHNNGSLTAAGIAAYQGFAPFLDVNFTTSSGTELTPGLFRRPSLFLQVEGAIARTILRSQRRREIGVGI